MKCSSKMTIAIILTSSLLLAGCIEKGEAYIEKNEVLVETNPDVSLSNKDYLAKIVSEYLNVEDFTSEPNIQSITNILEMILDEIPTTTAEQGESEQNLFKVKYVESRDGDTQIFRIISGISVSKDNAGKVLLNEIPVSRTNQNIVVRDLLIDTREVAKNGTPAEPFADEAHKFSHEKFSNAETIIVGYDKGDKQDHYNRELMYLWLDGKLYQESVLEAGLAEVAYVNEPNTTYLNNLLKAEQYAKERSIGIWEQQKK